MKTEKEKMIGGDAYMPTGIQLTSERDFAHKVCHEYSQTAGCTPEKMSLLKKHLGALGENCYIEPPFYCDYLYNISLGENVYMNFGCTLLDEGRITIGDNVKLGPNVQIYTVSHPLDPILRKSKEEIADEIKIGQNVWIGGGTIILPGVSIGENSVIGAGSVVTKDLPSGVIAVGNPCKVLRAI